VFIEIGERLPQFRDLAHILSHVLTTTRGTRDRRLRRSEALRRQPSPGKPNAWWSRSAETRWSVGQEENLFL